MAYWSREDMIMLVELYKKNHVLYTVKSADYHNRSLKRTAFEELTKQLNIRINKNFNVEEVKSKVTKLRSQFIEIMGKIKASHNQTNGDIYRPSWFLYNRLKFILPHIIHRKEKNKLNNLSCMEQHTDEPDSDDVEIKAQMEFVDVNQEIVPSPTNTDKSEFICELTSLDSESHATPSSSKSNVQHISKKIKTSDSTDDSFKEAVNPPSDNDELDYFFNYLKAETRKLDSDAQDYVKKVCFNAIFEAKK